MAKNRHALKNSLEPVRFQKLYAAACASICLLYLLLSIFPTQDVDVFMYLALARRFFADGHFPVNDPFLYTLPHARLELFHEWLSYVAAYGLYRLGGLGLITLAKAAMILLIPVTALAFARSLKYRSPITFILLLLAALCGSYRFIERSSVISDVLIAATLALVWLDRKRDDSPPSVWRPALALPPLFLAWVNLHPGFVIGLAICGLRLATDLGQWRQKSYRGFAALAAGSGLACLFNPTGLRGALYPIAFSSTDEYLKKFNVEWLPTLDPRFQSTGQVEGLILLLLITALLLAVLGLSARKKPVFETLVFALLAYVGLSAIRFAPTAAYGLTILCIALASELHVLAPVQGRAADWVWPKRLTLACAVFCALFSVKIAAWGYDAPSGHRSLGLGIDERDIPVVSAEKLEALAPEGNIYNSQDFGTYLAWKWDGRRKIFNHGFVTDFGFTNTDYLGLQRSRAEFMRVVAKYGIKVLYLDRDEGPMDQLVGQISKLPEWKVVYEDPASFILVKQGGGPAL